MKTKMTKLEYNRLYYANHREVLLERKKIYYSKFRAKILEYSRAYSRRRYYAIKKSFFNKKEYAEKLELLRAEKLNKLYNNKCETNRGNILGVRRSQV